MERRRVRVTGVVQGVGFRPFVHAAARRLGLTGFVRNAGDAVRIEVEGEPGPLDQFLTDLARPPAGARIATIHVESVPPVGSTTFVIESSHEAAGRPAYLPADVATCQACVA